VSREEQVLRGAGAEGEQVLRGHRHRGRGGVSGEEQVLREHRHDRDRDTEWDAGERDRRRHTAGRGKDIGRRPEGKERPEERRGERRGEDRRGQGKEGRGGGRREELRGRESAPCWRWRGTRSNPFSLTPRWRTTTGVDPSALSSSREAALRGECAPAPPPSSNLSPHSPRPPCPCPCSCPCLPPPIDPFPFPFPFAFPSSRASLCGREELCVLEC